MGPAISDYIMPPDSIIRDPIKRRELYIEEKINSEQNERSQNNVNVEAFTF